MHLLKHRPFEHESFVDIAGYCDWIKNTTVQDPILLAEINWISIKISACICNYIHAKPLGYDNSSMP